MRSAAVFLISLTAGCAEDSAIRPAPSYVDEAPLPEGWPVPGPYDKVIEKEYPAYRAAFTSGSGSTIPFMTLFAHIRKNGIPMTAPVEMSMKPDNEGLRQTSMAFLYQNKGVGQAGADGTKVEVRDIPASKALTYTWQGPDSKENIARARAALDAGLASSNLKTKGFRMLGYNGPDTPAAKRTWELQAVID